MCNGTKNCTTAQKNVQRHKNGAVVPKNRTMAQKPCNGTKKPCKCTKNCTTAQKNSATAAKTAPHLINNSGMSSAPHCKGTAYKFQLMQSVSQSFPQFQKVLRPFLDLCWQSARFKFYLFLPNFEFVCCKPASCVPSNLVSWFHQGFGRWDIV